MALKTAMLLQKVCCHTDNTHKSNQSKLYNDILGACRSAIATALTDWWANEYPQNATTKAAQSNFGAVDAFAFDIIQPTDVTVINATFIANISDGTPGVFTYVSQAWIGIQANTSAFATNVNSSASSQRRLLEDPFLAVIDDDDLGTSAAAMSAVGLLEAPHRQLLQSAQGDISALETKLLALVAAFYGASPCNNTVVSEAYYNGRTPVLNGDRPFACVNYSAGASDNIDTYLSSNSANWASLPLFHILVMNNRPVIVRQSPAVDVDRILAIDVNYQTQQYAASQASWQQQLACLNASIVNKRQLHELTALVEASLAVEGQIADSEIAMALYEQLLAISNDTLPLPYEQRQLLLDLQLSEEGSPVCCSFSAEQSMCLPQCCQYLCTHVLGGASTLHPACMHMPDLGKSPADCYLIA